MIKKLINNCRTNFETLLQEKYSHDDMDFENFWADYPVRHYCRYIIVRI